MYGKCMVSVDATLNLAQSLCTSVFEGCYGKCMAFFRGSDENFVMGRGVGRKYHYFVAFEW